MDDIFLNVELLLCCCYFCETDNESNKNINNHNNYSNIDNLLTLETNKECIKRD